MIVGNNAAQFTVSDITTNAQLWYTTDGSDPTNVAPSLYAGTIITSAKGITLSLPFPDDTNVMTFKVRGFRDGYSPSGNALQVFSSTNFVANTISFGFAPSDPVGQGEASSDFVASPGQTFFAPVTLLPLSGVTIYSMQFNLTVTNAGPIRVRRSHQAHLFSLLCCASPTLLIRDTICKFRRICLSTPIPPRLQTPCFMAAQPTL